MKRTVIIAEAGVNHNGDINIAKKLVRVASNAGADYIKFQTFNTKLLVSKEAIQAEYQKNNTKNEISQFDLLSALELSIDEHHQLIDYCAENKIGFLSTAFDNDSIDFLATLDLDYYKIPSGEVTNKPYLEKIAQKKKPIIMSSGMCDMNDIERALKILTTYTSPDQITVLHCNTEYPTPMEDVNLLAMNTISERYNVNIGYSDHTMGIEVPIAAAALGAKIVEKHFSINRDMPGPDHKASLLPNELKEMVQGIRNIDVALGNKEKKPTPSELKNRTAARKSIHTINALKKNTIISEDLLVMLRPGDGISPMEIDEIIGKKITTNLNSHHKLNWDDFE